jgi:hypothetical protein
VLFLGLASVSNNDYKISFDNRRILRLIKKLIMFQSPVTQHFNLLPSWENHEKIFPEGATTKPLRGLCTFLEAFIL